METSFIIIILFVSGMSFHLTVPSSPPSLSNGYASHHKDFMSSVSFSSNKPVHSPPSHMTSNPLTSGTTNHTHLIDSLAHHLPHNGTGECQPPPLLVKPDATHMMYPPSALHAMGLAPPHMHSYAPNVIPTQLSGKHIGVLTSTKREVQDFHPPTLSHTPVIIAE